MVGVSVVARPAGWRRGGNRFLVILATVAILAGALGMTLAVQASPVRAAHAYDNPLPVTNEGTAVESCADPSVIYDPVPANEGGTELWYMYCTTDPLTEADTEFHKIPQFSSEDLVNWTYEGDAFPQEGGVFPAYAEAGSGLWAPEIDFIDGTWYLYYTVVNTTDAVGGQNGCPFDPAIGVATSDNPLGPWVDSGDPVVDPNNRGGTCNYWTTIDPDVITAEDGTNYIYWGGFYGGIFSRELVDEADGEPTLWTDTVAPARQEDELRITIANRYEGPEVIFRDGYYYLFVSAANCCNGPLTGYAVFSGRSTNPTGPFVDAQGRSLLEVRVGGTPVLAMNGNRWVGPGHNTVFQDFEGQWWTIYHAIPMDDPYLAATGINERPALLDPLDFTAAAGFPSVRSGCWISDEPMPAPAAQPDHGPSGYVPSPCGDVDMSRFELVEELSDEFDGESYGPQWSWVREPQPTEDNPEPYAVEGGTFQFDTQYGDLHEDQNNVGVLLEASPDGEYVVETRVHVTVPADPDSFWHNFRQAGLVIYAGDEGTTGDDDYVRLMHVSIWDTRQVEFAKERNADAAAADGGPRFGGHVLGPPHEWTFLRIHVIPLDNGVELYQAYSSQDADANGEPDAWIKGGVWTHDLGSRIGLGSFGAGGPCDVPDADPNGCQPPGGGEPNDTTASFDWVRVYTLPEAAPTDPGTASPAPTDPGTASPAPTTTGSPAASVSGTASPASTATASPPATGTVAPGRTAAPLPNTAAGDAWFEGTLLVVSAALLTFGSAAWLLAARPIAIRRRR